MNVISTEFKDLFILEPQIFKDERGYFFEAYSEKKLEESGLNYNFVQDNQSESSFGVIRGLHYQLNPFGQAKLIRVLSGTILDVVVDIRIGSPTFLKVFKTELSDINCRQLLIPRGFAHGFSVKSDKAAVLYKCDNYYNKNSERGLLWNDKQLEIDWEISVEKIILSDKDKINSNVKNFETNFYF